MTTLMKSAIGMGMLAVASASAPAAGNDYFILHTLEYPPEEAAAMVRDYAQEKEDWLFLAEFDLAGGAVTAVKICYPAIGPDIVAAGMHTMAMMPCGHLAFYEEDGESKLSMLDPSFMTALYPDPNLDNAVATVRPAFDTLLSEVLGVE